MPPPTPPPAKPPPAWRSAWLIETLSELPPSGGGSSVGGSVGAERSIVPLDSDDDDPVPAAKPDDDRPRLPPRRPTDVAHDEDPVDVSWAFVEMLIDSDVDFETECRWHRPSRGVIYAAEPTSHTIVKVEPDRHCSHWVGRARKSGFVDGFCSSALLSCPSGVTVDTLTGDAFIADSGNNAIRWASPAGEVTTLAGGGPSRPGFADGRATAGRFNLPTAVSAVRRSTEVDIFVLDTRNSALRKVSSPAGDVTTVARGLRGAEGLHVICAHGDERIALVTEGIQHRLVAVDVASGEIVHLCGSARGDDGDAEGAPDDARLYFPAGVTATVDHEAPADDDHLHFIVFLSDSENHRIRGLRLRIEAPGSEASVGPRKRVTCGKSVLIVGDVFDVGGDEAPGFADGEADESSWHNPRGMVPMYPAPAGPVVLVADFRNAAVRSIRFARVVDDDARP